MKRLEERIPNLNDRLYPKHIPKRRLITEDIPTYKLNLSNKKPIFDINNAYRSPIIVNEIKLGSNQEVKPYKQNSTVIHKRQSKKRSHNPQILQAKTISKDKEDDHIPQQMIVDPVDDSMSKTENQLDNEKNSPIVNMNNEQKENSKYPFIKWHFNKAKTPMKKDTTVASTAQNSKNNAQEVASMELDETKQMKNDKPINEGNEANLNINNANVSPVEINTNSPSMSQLHENDNNFKDKVKLEKTVEKLVRKSEIVNEITIEGSEGSNQSKNEKNINTEDYLEKICTEYVNSLPRGQKGTKSNKALVELMLLQLNSKPVVFINKLNQDVIDRMTCSTKITTPRKTSFPEKKTPSQTTAHGSRKKNTKEVNFVKQSSLKRKSPNGQVQLNDNSAKKPLVSILKKPRSERTFYSKQSLCTPKVKVTKLDLNELLRLSCSRDGPIFNIGDVYNVLKESQMGTNEAEQSPFQPIQEKMEKCRLDIDLESSSLPIDKYKQLLSQASTTATVDNCERRGLVEMCYYKDCNVAGKVNKITFNTFQSPTSSTSREIPVHKTLDDSSKQISDTTDITPSVQDMMSLLNTNIWKDFTAHVSGRARCASGVLKTSPLLQRGINLGDTQFQTSPTKFPSPLRNSNIDLNNSEMVKNSSSSIGDNFNDELRLMTPHEIIRAQKELSMDYSPGCAMNNNIPSHIPNSFLSSDPNPLMHLGSILNSKPSENMQQLLEEEMKRKSILAQLLEVCKPDSQTLQYGSETLGSNLQNPLVNLWDSLQCHNIKSEPQFHPPFDSDDE